MLAVAALSFMPEGYHDRIQSIASYQQDTSALGRLNAWAMAFNLANDRPLIGGGFEIYNLRVFAEYAPNPTAVHSAHSIYFQVLGEHGYMGLFLFLLMWFLVWRDGTWIIRQTQGRGDLRWANDLARMIQVSLVGYAVGGTFLNLAYYDVPYYLITALVLTRVLVEKSIREAVPAPESAPRPATQPEAAPATADWGVSGNAFRAPDARQR
jgi:probable O-glycosylation ligase (exosortase A-associated)